MSYTISYRPIQTEKYIVRNSNTAKNLVDTLRKAFGEPPITLDANDQRIRYRLEGMIPAGLQELQQLLDELNSGVSLILTWSS